MIKNRTAQLIFQTIYCTLGLVGIIACFGIFDDVTKFRWDFYVYFTNISNFLCFGVMLAALIQTIRKKGNSYVTTAPILKFIGILGILLTFFIFNIMIAPGRGADFNYNLRIGSLTFHVILPVMYVAHWFLFYERKKCRWFYPLTSIAFPLGYVSFLLIQAIILGFDSSIKTLGGENPAPLIYPYFFVNPESKFIFNSNIQQGWPGVLMWIAIISVAFIAAGFIFYGLDKIGRKAKK